MRSKVHRGVPDQGWTTWNGEATSAAKRKEDVRDSIAWQEQGSWKRHESFAAQAALSESRDMHMDFHLGAPTTNASIPRQQPKQGGFVGGSRSPRGHYDGGYASQQNGGSSSSGGERGWTQVERPRGYN